MVKTPIIRHGPLGYIIIIIVHDPSIHKHIHTRIYLDHNQTHILDQDPL